MQLALFAPQKGARSISADQLDANFSKLRPISADGPARQYAITETDQGWFLTIYPENILANLSVNFQNAENANESYYLTSSGGQLQWSSASSVNQTIAQQAVNELNAMTPAQFNNLLSNVYGVNFQPREVERCDGSRMLVLGTEWY